LNFDLAAELVGFDATLVLNYNLSIRTILLPEDAVNRKDLVGVPDPIHIPVTETNVLIPDCDDPGVHAPFVRCFSFVVKT
jgi:hypothetical protein